MTTIIKQLLLLLSFIISSLVQGQSFTATVQNAKTGEAVPFATVQFSENSGTITNEEGVFTIDIARLQKIADSIHISSMGYEKMAILPKKATDTIINLKTKVNELDNLFLTTNPLDVENIIDRVKENLTSNYPDKLTQSKIFYRKSESNSMDKMDVEVEKTTIPEFNQAFMDSLVGAVEKSSKQYSESVGTLFGNYTKQKLQIERAANLYDKSKKDVGVENFGKRLEDIVEKNVKPDSYFKIKSGIIGTTIEVDDSTQVGNPKGGLKIEVNTDDDEIEEAVTENVRRSIHSLLGSTFFNEESKLDFLSKSNRYEFTKRSFTSIGDEIVYIIDFEPKGRKDFKGTMYVNTNDFAVMRLEYENVRNLKSISLFGISYKEFLYKGKSIYAKDESGGYALRYMELEEGIKVGLDRPLKIIEKNKNVKGRRKQNEVSMEIEMKNTATTKKELVVFEQSRMDEVTFQNTTESDKIEATYLPAYDPNFWKGYSIIEPNTAIQAFKSAE